jgi:Bacterial Ig-like domain
MNGHISSTVAALGFAGIVILGTTACSDTGTNPNEDQEFAALLSILPTPGSLDVEVGATVVVTFDHAIAAGMGAYAALHEGTLTGPEVEGTWALSEARTELIFTPAEELKPSTTYVIHLGGGMMDEDGNPVDLEEHGMGMGGQWATEQMLAGGMGMGQMGGQGGGMMGEGWAHGSNGTYGMVFTFTTAA